jgi:hypothetical protein
MSTRLAYVWLALNEAGEYAIGTNDREIGVIGSLSDAQAIKRAVDAHDALVAALKSIIECPHARSEMTLAQIEGAVAALAKAQ